MMIISFFNVVLAAFKPLNTAVEDSLSLVSIDAPIKLMQKLKLNKSISKKLSAETTMFEYWRKCS